MSVEQDPLLTLHLLWPEIAPDHGGTLDHETLAIAERRAKTTRLWAQKQSMRKVVAALEADGVKSSLGTVSRDVHEVMSSYLLIAVQEAHKHVARELMYLTRIEAELWESWDKSKQKRTKTRTQKGQTAKSSTQSAMVESQERDGDPRIMKLILEAWHKRCALLGLLKMEDKGKGALPPVKYVRGIDPVEMV